MVPSIQVLPSELSHVLPLGPVSLNIGIVQAGLYHAVGRSLQKLQLLKSSQQSQQERDPFYSNKRVQVA